MLESASGGGSAWSGGVVSALGRSAWSGEVVVSAWGVSAPGGEGGGGGGVYSGGVCLVQGVGVVSGPGGVGGTGIPVCTEADPLPPCPL